MRFESPDITSENIEKIAALFPLVVTEKYVDSENKKLSRCINFDILRTMLGDNIADNEAYEFTWVGKKEAVMEVGRPIRKSLRPYPDESKNWDSTKNLYIEGDNLDVLKLLQESYLSKVKMIYIDPPYNTGHDFVYRDSEKMDLSDYEDKIFQYDGDDNLNFKKLPSSDIRFHSKWCSMMYPRLVLSRNLLADDGFIFISIGDEEVNNLRKICDEIFGEANFRNQIIVRRGTKSVQAQFDTWDKLGQGCEYILLYSKTQTYRFPKQTKSLEQMKVGSWNNHWRGTDRPTMRYSLFEIIPESGQWRWSKERSEIAIQNYQKMISELGINEVDITQEEIDQWYKNQHNSNLDLLRLSKTGKPEHYIAPTDETLLNSSWIDILVGSSSEINKLFECVIFDTAKLTSVINRMLKFVPNDALILDFFSGSATTAHAVMQLNAEDGGNRKFIMVQIPENTDKISESYKAGYKNICEIGKERIRRAGEKIKNENKDHSNLGNLDVGFRVLKLDNSNMKDVYYAAGDYTQDLLSLTESNIKEDRTDMDLLYGCLLEWGLPLSQSHTREEIDGVTIHIYNEGDLIACFSEKVSETVVKEIANQHPLRVVFKDNSFSCSSEKINIEEIFKLISPNTVLRVI